MDGKVGCSNKELISPITSHFNLVNTKFWCYIFLPNGAYLKAPLDRQHLITIDEKRSSALPSING